MTVCIYTDCFIATQCKGFADDRFCICTAHRYQVNSRRRISFFQFDGTNQCIPFIIGINDPLYSIDIEFRVIVSESYFCRCVRRFTDTNQDLHCVIFNR